MPDDGRNKSTRCPSMKARHLTHTSNWKSRLRENCYARVRDDRARLLWKIRSPIDQSMDEKEFINSTFQDIVSDELKKMDSSFNDCIIDSSSSSLDEKSIIWEYDGLDSVYQGECEEILLEMQKIFYEELNMETISKESNPFGTWEDEEDEYLARAVYEQMNLNGVEACKEIWCPICTNGELKQNNRLIYCNHCKLELNRGDEVNLEMLKDRLGEAHEEHLSIMGCTFKPKFFIQTAFNLSALYIQCEICGMFEIVI